MRPKRAGPKQSGQTTTTVVRTPRHLGRKDLGTAVKDRIAAAPPSEADRAAMAKVKAEIMRDLLDVKARLKAPLSPAPDPIETFHGLSVGERILERLRDLEIGADDVAIFMVGGRRIAITRAALTNEQMAIFNVNAGLYMETRPRNWPVEQEVEPWYLDPIIGFGAKGVGEGANVGPKLDALMSYATAVDVAEYLGARLPTLAEIGEMFPLAEGEQVVVEREAWRVKDGQINPHISLGNLADFAAWTKVKPPDGRVTKSAVVWQIREGGVLFSRRGLFDDCAGLYPVWDFGQEPT
ncbi:hypothetical protein ACFL5U_00325 [Candidatus Margulisiibacteriota bacterium]